MAEELGPDEVRKQHIRDLGPELGPLHNAIYNEWGLLSLKVAQFNDLYGTSEERVALLNESAGLFFRVIHDVLFDDILMHLARLTDPQDSGKGRDNMTIRRMPALITNPEFQADIQALVEEAVAATRFVEGRRNKHIAHLDLQIALGERVHFERGSLKNVKDALHAIFRILKRVEKQIDSDLDDGVLTGPDDAVSLLYVIRNGIEDRKERMALAREGKLDPSKLNRGPI